MKKIVLFLCLLCMPMLAACGSVDAGNVGLWNRFGKIDSVAADEGLHFYNPLTVSLETMSVQETPWKSKTPVYTRDLQSAAVDFNVTTSLDRSQAVKMRNTVGLEWREKILPQNVESVIKDVYGRYDAGDAIAERDKIQAIILDRLRAQLRPRGITVNDFQLTNIKYSDAFEDAVERAQVATQKANEAKNRTVEVEENAKQTKIDAEAQAESIRVQANAITSNPAIVQLKWVEKWDGSMPGTVYCSSSTPCVGGGK